MGFLESKLHYDQCSGVFTWVNSKNNRVAGTPDYKGYISIGLNKKQYRAHRLAWFYCYGVWPKESIDHINGIKNDNRIANLRDVSDTENKRNAKKYKTNKSGMQGVSWHSRDKKWNVNIGGGGRKVFLGGTTDKFNAFCIRKSAENKLNYHDNHGRDETGARFK